MLLGILLFIVINFLYKKAYFILTNYGLIISEDLNPFTSIFRMVNVSFFFLLQSAKISYCFFFRLKYISTLLFFLQK